MSYQVLARKYRPRSFQEMVGQEHVLRALLNALDQNRLHHAYLFTGTRGVGKTTLARILAKCLNCEKGVSASPCEQCLNCQEINEGRFLDLIEVDAASRTKVEDTRELLENVQYAPTRGRYKVYLIDEVHMLSGHSFNALLKTLEEPPPHVKFLLATTDPQRLPVTVLSRCLQFNLKNLAAEKIKSHLAKVLNQESITFEAAALGHLAKGANGSVRDALSLLDQAVAYCGGQITESAVSAMLGTIEQTQIFQLLNGLTSGDTQIIITAITQLADHAADFAAALEDLLAALHQIALAQILPSALDSSIENFTIIQNLAGKLTPEDVQLYYQIGLIGRRDLPLAPTPRSGFEMILLRMLAFSPMVQKAEPGHAALSPGYNPVNKSATVARVSVSERPDRSNATMGALQVRAGVSKNTMPHPGTVTLNYVETSDMSAENLQHKNYNPVINPATEDWSQIITQLNLTGFALALAKNCSLKEITTDTVHLFLDPSQTALRNPKQEARLAEALSSYYAKPLRVQINVGNPALNTPTKIQQAKESAQLTAATTALNNDSNVQAILELFDATIQSGSIQVKDSKAFPDD